MNGKPNYKRKLLSTASYVEQQVARFFAIDKVFYQDNEIGEIVRNYLITSAKTNIVSLKWKITGGLVQISCQTVRFYEINYYLCNVN